MDKIERIRAVVSNMLMIASDDLRRARIDNDHEQAGLIEVERDAFARVIAIIDAVLDEP